MAGSAAWGVVGAYPLVGVVAAGRDRLPGRGGEPDQRLGALLRRAQPGHDPVEEREHRAVVAEPGPDHAGVVRGGEMSGQRRAASAAKRMLACFAAAVDGQGGTAGRPG